MSNSENLLMNHLSNIWSFQVPWFSDAFWIQHLECNECNPSIHRFSPWNRLFFFVRSVQAPVFAASQELPSAWAKIAKSKVLGRQRKTSSGSQAAGSFGKKKSICHISLTILLSDWSFFFFFWDVVDRGSMLNYIHGCFCFPIILF